MAILTEGKYLNDILKWELEKQQSREIVNITEGQALVVGEVVGKVTLSVPTTGTGTGTGDGTMTSVVGGAETKLGTYTLTCTTAGSSGGGTFSVITPDGNSLPDVTATTAGFAYSNSHLGFTLTEGSTDFALDDTFTVEVTAGAGGIMVLTPAAVDGSQKAHGILIDDYTNTAKTAWAASTAYALHDIVIPTTANSHTYKCTVAGSSAASPEPTWPTDGSTVVDSGVTWVDQGTIPASKGVAIVRDAQIVEDNLTFPTGITNAQKATAMSELKEKSIVTREEA